MKKIITLFIIILSVLLCGCGKDNNTETILKFSSWGSRTEYGILKQIIEEYEKKNPNIKIEFIHVPENYFRKLHLLYASKTEPDVVFVNNTYAPLYIKADLFEDLSGKIDEKLYFKSALDCFKYDNKLYVIPRDVSNLVIFVNKTLVKHPESIKSIEDLRETAKNVSKNGVFGLNFEKNPVFWLYYLEYFNGGILSDDGEKIIFNSPNSIQGLNFYADMINKDQSIPHDWQMSGMTSAQMFINGKIAMYLSGRWLVPKFRESITFDWDVIPFPQTDISHTLTDASGWAVSKSSKNKEAAIDFVKYLSSEKTSRIFAKSGLITPARIETANSNDFLAPEEKPKNTKAFIEAIEKSKPTPVNPNYAKIIDDVTKAADKVFTGKQKSEDIMTQRFIQKLQQYCSQ